MGMTGKDFDLDDAFYGPVQRVRTRAHTALSLPFARPERQTITALAC